jgi:hypothetical protein
MIDLLEAKILWILNIKVQQTDKGTDEISETLDFEILAS